MPIPTIRSKSAAALAAGLLSLASSAPAAVVCNSGAPMPFTVPQTLDGVYVNLVTNAFQTTAPTAGWDFNPYSQTGPLLTFWFNNNASLGAVSNGTNYLVLPAGATIGPTSTFSNGNSTALMTNWRTTNTGQYVGIRFINESAGSITNYGWVQLDTGATSGFPATINGYCYQDNGTQILAGGTVPVELQSFDAD